MKKFKFLIGLFFFSMLVVSCSKESACLEVNKGEVFEFKTGDVICHEEFEITIVEINDERCPCDAVCVWEGEFTFTVEILKDQSITEYTFHESRVLAMPIPFGLDFVFEKVISDPGCGGEVDTSTLLFSMRID